MVYENGRWILWYNGRNGLFEQIGIAFHEGEDLGFDSRYEPVSWRQVRLTGGFWAHRQEINVRETLPAVYGQFEKTGRFSAMTLNWREGAPNQPHVYYDSDVAKWIEGAAYMLTMPLSAQTITQIEEKIETLVDLVEEGMTPEGYFNSYYLSVEPYKRFTERNNHELYCAGHFMEAAVVYAQATGKTRLLALMQRYAAYIRRVFFEEKSAPKYKTPGHEEIELALVRLWEATGESEWLSLAKYFVDTRGMDPDDEQIGYSRKNVQDHAPVRDQAVAEGHAVRWGYLFCAAADVARATGDLALLNVCEKVWRDVIDRKIYVTGGIGALGSGEAFGPAYFLPNFECYAETCASIGLAFFANRMLQIERKAEYADIFELEMYNGTLAGVSLDGKAFFYENPLYMNPADQLKMKEMGASVKPTTRQEMFSCSCCPPNILRFIASLSGYFYGADSEHNTVFVNHYGEGEATIAVNNLEIHLTQETRYPWDGHIKICVHLSAPSDFTLAIRIPGWCEGAEVSRQGTDVDGYYYIAREWSDGDEVLLNFPMPVTELAADPRVSQDCGRVALKRGPLVYCVEEVDNGPRLSDLLLDTDVKYSVEWREELLGGINAICFPAKRRAPFSSLYQKWRPAKEETNVIAVPYNAWANRGEGEMAVWLMKK